MMSFKGWYMYYLHSMVFLGTWAGLGPKNVLQRGQTQYLV